MHAIARTARPINRTGTTGTGNRTVPVDQLSIRRIALLATFEAAALGQLLLREVERLAV